MLLTFYEQYNTQNAAKPLKPLTDWCSFAGKSSATPL